MSSAIHSTESLVFEVVLQLIIIIGAARVMNVLFRRLGQPGVVGEIVAGLMLGPSLFGHFFPDAAASIFTAGSAEPLAVLSQIGLVLLMFQIGAGFEFGLLKDTRLKNAAIAIGVASVAVPFALGFGLGWLAHPDLASGSDRVAFSLFVGVAIAITAVPILGRILSEFRLNRTPVGVVAISAAALNDIIGWVLLAGISAYAAARFTAGGFILQIGAIIAFALAMRFLLAPMVSLVLSRFEIRDGQIPPNLLAMVLALIFALGLATHQLDIFFIFGGFVAGLLVHRHKAFVEAWDNQVGRFVLVFFLPIFFTFTGLRTDFLGLTDGTDFLWLLAVLVVSVLAKVFPVYLAARATGFNRPEAATMGSLLNTRALMELIVLNVGYELGILPENMFAILVAMAVVTTIMTGPLLRLLLPHLKSRSPEDASDV